jgi:uncharacterized protein
MSNSHSGSHIVAQRSAGQLQVLNAPAHLEQVRYEAPVAKKIPFWTLAGALFLMAAVGFLIVERGTPIGTTLGVSFVSIILEALPFVILGSLVSGIIEVFVPKEAVARLLPKRKLLGVLAAATLGVFVPVCECAVIPFTRRLVRKGVPFSTAVAYLLAGPTVNVLTGSSTLLAYHNPLMPGFSWHVLAARTGFAYFIAVAVALIIDRIFPGHSALLDPAMEGISHEHSCGCGHDHDHEDAHEHHHDHEHAHEHQHAQAHEHACDCGHDHHHERDHDHHHEEAREPTLKYRYNPRPQNQHAHTHDHDHSHDHSESGSLFRGRLAESLNHAGGDFLEVGQFLIIGAFVAAICQTLIPREAFVAVAHAPGMAILVMMGLAVALNLCSGANAFVAASFRGALPMSAQMGFMLLGPMLDTKLSAMYLSFISKRAFLTLLVLVYTMVFATMMLWHYFSFVGGMR